MSRKKNTRVITVEKKQAIDKTNKQLEVECVIFEIRISLYTLSKSRREVKGEGKNWCDKFSATIAC